MFSLLSLVSICHRVLQPVVLQREDPGLLLTTGPHLCYRRALPSTGGVRVCVVPECACDKQRVCRFEIFSVSGRVQLLQLKPAKPGLLMLLTSLCLSHTRMHTLIHTHLLQKNANIDKHQTGSKHSCCKSACYFWCQTDQHLFIMKLK